MKGSKHLKPRVVRRDVRNIKIDGNSNTGDGGLEQIHQCKSLSGNDLEVLRWKGQGWGHSKLASRHESK